MPNSEVERKNLNLGSLKNEQWFRESFYLSHMCDCWLNPALITAALQPKLITHLCSILLPCPPLLMSNTHIHACMHTYLHSHTDLPPSSPNSGLHSPFFTFIRTSCHSTCRAAKFIDRCFSLPQLAKVLSYAVVKKWFLMDKI